MGLRGIIRGITAPHHCVGGWFSDDFCHCGRRRTLPLNRIRFDVCPDCGHSDKWSRKVVRSEWDAGLFGIRSNQKLVEWTPEHCPVKGDE